MAVLKQEGGDRIERLSHRTLVGRDPACALRIKNGHVSGEHASIRWERNMWRLKDLGSTNGTWINGDRLSVGEERSLMKDDRIAFGSPELVWILEDDQAPRVAARDLVTEEIISARRDMLQLPSGEEPSATVYRNEEAVWVADTGDFVRPVADGERVEIEGKHYELQLPELYQSTLRDQVPSVDNIELRFTVSSDEEHVSIECAHRDRVFDVPDRVYHYMLLTLARLRIEDQQDDEISEAQAGWIYADDLCHQLRIEAKKLNVDVHRARKLFEDLSIEGAARLVERRPNSGQIRIGVSRLKVTRL